MFAQAVSQIHFVSKKAKILKYKEKPKNRRADDCVFLPALVTSWVGISTIFASSFWEWSMHCQLSGGLTVLIVSSSHFVCTAPTWLSLMRAARLAIPLVLVPQLLRHSKDCCHGNHKWIKQRDPRWGRPYFGPHQSM